MYDYFVRRTADNDFCLVINEDKSHETIGNIISHIVAEYEKKDAMYMLAVQSGIHMLLIEIARNVEKSGIMQRESIQTSACHVIIFWNILIRILLNRWRYSSWQRCAI